MNKFHNEIHNDGNIIICNNDCMDVLNSDCIKPESIDLVLTDPPYGINYKSNHYKYEWSKRYNSINNDDVLFLPIDLLWSKIKDGGSMFAFYSYKNARIDPRKKNSIIWVKNNHTAGDLYGDFGNKYENIAFKSEGKFKLKGKRYTNVWEFDRVKSSIHPTEKPIDLLIRIIECATDPGDIVLDPFAGSGSTVQACKITGRRCIGIEMSEEYCDYIVNSKDRLGQEVLGI